MDTTVFCGALVKPDGLNMRLLKLGATRLYVPVISQAVIAEFIHKTCSDGIGKGSGKRIYTPDETGQFLDGYRAILDPASAIRVGTTYDFVSTFPADTPLWVVLSKMSESWPSEAALAQKLNRPLKEIDPGDLHLMLAAVQSHPDYLVSSNRRHLKVLDEFCKVLTPSEFLTLIDAL